MDLFLDEFNGIKVQGKIKIKNEWLFPFHSPSIEYSFLHYLINHRNRFTVKSIQEFEDDVNICVYETDGVLSSTQVEPIPISDRILNWRKDVWKRVCFWRWKFG